MNNRKYIGQILAFLFSGMIIPFFMIYSMRYDLYKFSNDFLYIFWIMIVSGCLEKIAYLKFNQNHENWWIGIQLFFYLTFWILIGMGLITLTGCDRHGESFLLYIIYEFSVIVTIISFLLGFFFKKIKRGVLLGGIIVGILTIIYWIIIGSLWGSVLFLILITLCCYYSNEQLNKLKSIKSFTSKSERLAMMINTSMNMGFDFLGIVFHIKHQIIYGEKIQ